MQQAKKLVLLDEFDREYKRLQRPADVIAKTGRSLQLSDTLRESSLDDDRKVKEYVAALHRYLNVRKELPSVELPPSPPPPLPPSSPLPPSRRGVCQESGRQYSRASTSAVNNLYYVTSGTSSQWIT